MPLETPIYVNDFVITNPTSGDPKSQGDDHIRNTKAALKVTFSGFLGAVIVTGTDTGNGAAYVVNPSTAVPNLRYGMRVVFTAVNANTGPATLAVSGLAAAPVIHANGQALVAGDLLAGRIVEVVYDGASFQIVGGSGYLSRTGNQTLNGALSITGAFSSGGAGTFAGGLTAAGPLVLTGATGNVTAPGTGVNDFSAGDTLVKILPFGSPDSSKAVSVAQLNATAFNAVLPGQGGQGGKVLWSDGTSASWQYKNADLALMGMGYI